MKFLTRIAVLWYVTLILFLSSFVLLFALNWIEVHHVLNFVATVYFDENLRMISIVTACSMILLNYIFYQAFNVNIHKEKTIAFDNPAGRVSVSLGAIEDLTKRIISRISEVREVKSKIVATKKGLQIRVRLILRAEGSIPEVTSRVQDLVKKKVQDTIGLDEPIEVAIYVGKILSEQGKESRPSKQDMQKEGAEANVPFQGYRA